MKLLRSKDPDTKCPPIESLLPPKGAPNVLVILIDGEERVRMMMARR